MLAEVKRKVTAFQTEGFSPVVVFGFNRPEKLRSCIEALEACADAEKTRVTVIIDGPRNAQDIPDVQGSVRVTQEEWRFAGLEVVCRETNIGLANSIISGVSDMLAEHETIIVLEDDLVVAPGFVRFMNAALDFYRMSESVVSIHGYVYPLEVPTDGAFFLRGADCWGWATWRRGWEIFNPDAQSLLKQLKKSKIQRLFDFNKAYPFTKMLRDQAAGRIDSWAVRWYASAFLAGKYTLYPGQSMVANNGFDGSGTHSNVSRVYEVLLHQNLKVDLPVFSGENEQARLAFELFFKEQGFLARARRKIKKSLRNFLLRRN